MQVYEEDRKIVKQSRNSVLGKWGFGWINTNVGKVNSYCRETLFLVSGALVLGLGL